MRDDVTSFINSRCCRPCFLPPPPGFLFPFPLSSRNERYPNKAFLQGLQVIHLDDVQDRNTEVGLFKRANQSIRHCAMHHTIGRDCTRILKEKTKGGRFQSRFGKQRVLGVRIVSLLLKFCPSAESLQLTSTVVDCQNK